MPPPALDTVFDYLALLINERETNEPFLLGQLQPAVTYKFPEFKFADYGLTGAKAFIELGEKAGYFKLVNTGDIRTMYLAPGTKKPTIHTGVRVGTGELRRLWMSEYREALLNAERGDQLADIVRDNGDVLTAEFDAYLQSEEHAAELYSVKGRVRRIREFLAALRERGEALAIGGWQPNRAVLRTPPIPPIKDAPKMAALVMAVIQGQQRADQTPLEFLNNMLFGVIGFYRYQLSREKAWDWVAGLDMLEGQFRALHDAAEKHHLDALKKQQERAGTGRLLGAVKNIAAQAQKLPPRPPNLDVAQIEIITKSLLREAGIRATQDDTPLWREFVSTNNLEESLRHLEQHPNLLKDDRLLNWLEDEIAACVGKGDMDGVRNLANKATIAIAARQSGIDGVRQSPGALKEIFASVMDGARLLGLTLNYLRPAPTPQAVAYLGGHAEMIGNEAVGVILDEQLEHAARAGDVNRYRLVSDRIDLWFNVSELGMEQGPGQHERYLRNRREDKTLLIEMGLLLMPDTKDIEERRAILERFPAVATPEGVAMVNATLDNLSFRGAPQEQYQRYFEVKRLVERCVQIGIDRALAELK